MAQSGHNFRHSVSRHQQIISNATYNSLDYRRTEKGNAHNSRVKIWSYPWQYQINVYFLGFAVIYFSLWPANNAGERRQLYTAFGLQYFGRPNSILCHIFGVKCRIHIWPHQPHIVSLNSRILCISPLLWHYNSQFCELFNLITSWFLMTKYYSHLFLSKKVFYGNNLTDFTYLKMIQW